MATLAQVIERVATVMASVPGVRSAPTAPPEQMNVFPFGVVYPADGDNTFATPGERLALDSIAVELHVG